jgi:hypothetical protein
MMHNKATYRAGSAVTGSDYCRTLDGTKHWYLNRKLHRTDGPAVEYTDGTKYWCLNGEFHRTDGPAIEFAGGGKYWYFDGKRHRIDGPAIEFASGHKEWHINGTEYSFDEFIIKANWTTEQIAIWKLKYA